MKVATRTVVADVAAVAFMATLRGHGELSRRSSESRALSIIARSGLPSPLKSLTVGEKEPDLTGLVTAGWKVPLPLPRSTLRLLAKALTTARSTFPSPFRSASADLNGWATIGYLSGFW